MTEPSHDIAIRAPLTVTPMLHDPVVEPCKGFDPVFVRHACLYAASVLRRDPQWSGDLSRLHAEFQAPATVVFRSGRTIVARVEIAARVMTFDPHKPVLRLTDRSAA